MQAFQQMGDVAPVLRASQFQHGVKVNIIFGLVKDFGRGRLAPPRQCIERGRSLRNFRCEALQDRAPNPPLIEAVRLESFPQNRVSPRSGHLREGRHIIAFEPIVDEGFHALQAVGAIERLIQSLGGRHIRPDLGDREVDVVTEPIQGRAGDPFDFLPRQLCFVPHTHEHHLRLRPEMVDEAPRFPGRGPTERTDDLATTELVAQIGWDFTTKQDYCATAARMVARHGGRQPASRWWTMPVDLDALRPTTG